MLSRFDRGYCLDLNTLLTEFPFLRVRKRLQYNLYQSFARKYPDSRTNRAEKNGARIP